MNYRSFVNQKGNVLLHRTHIGDDKLQAFYSACTPTLNPHPIVSTILYYSNRDGYRSCDAGRAWLTAEQFENWKSFVQSWRNLKIINLLNFDLFWAVRALARRNM